MGTVAEAALPFYSYPNHLQLLPTSSVRRRRFITAVVLLAGFASLVFCHHYLFVRQRTAQVPLSIDIDPIPTVALSPLGLEAEKVYHLGSLSLSDYNSSLQAFIDTAFPSPLKAQLSQQLHRYLDFDSSEPLPEKPNIIWQTNDILPVNINTLTWQYTNSDYKYNFLHDGDAEKWVHKHFKNSAIEWTWNTLPQAVLKADFLRYLLLLIEGGTYSDIDTACLRPISDWGSDPDVRGQIGNGLPPTTIVGIEADVGDRADWHNWWSRPIQIVQWTISSSPGHPLLLDTVRKIYAKTVEAQHSHGAKMDTGENLDDVVSVLEWTGPAVFTDATLRFLRIQSDLKWTDLRGLQKPLQAGSVTILPVTGFSPGVGNFGAKGTEDEQAMVHHDFRGSWKGKHSHDKRFR